MLYSGGGAVDRCNVWLQIPLVYTNKLKVAECIPHCKQNMAIPHPPKIDCYIFGGLPRYTEVCKFVNEK